MTLDELQKALKSQDWHAIWISAQLADLPASAPELVHAYDAPPWLKNLFGSSSAVPIKEKNER